MKDEAELDKLIKFVDQVRKHLGDKIPIQQLATLLEIAKKQGITASQIANNLRLSDSAAGRNVSLLTQDGWPRGSGGYDLIRVERDPFDAKRKMCKLNPKGENVMSELKRAIK